MTETASDPTTENRVETPPASGAHQPHTSEDVVAETVHRHHDEVVVPGLDTPDEEPPFTGHPGST